MTKRIPTRLITLAHGHIPTYLATFAGAAGGLSCPVFTPGDESDLMPAKSHAHKHVAIAAGTTDVHDDAHTTDAAPTVFGLTDDQTKQVKGLHYLSAYELAHLPKAAPDVSGAFDEAALKTIGANQVLGGEARVAQIRGLVAQHAQLADIAAVLAPLIRLVGQNLVSIDSALAGHVGQTLKVASGLSGTTPHLAEGLAHAKQWSKAHHRGRGQTHAADPSSNVPAADPKAT